jgi:hypothetical protein
MEYVVALWAATMLSAWLAFTYLVYRAYFVPATPREKRAQEKLDALIARWKNDPDFDSFTEHRWFNWLGVCDDMGWFKS